MKFQIGDRIQVNDNGSTALIVAIDSSFAPYGITHMYTIIWYSFRDMGECSYAANDVDDMWTKIDNIRDAQIGIEYAPADVNDRLPRGLSSQGLMDPGIEFKKECTHKWVEVGFAHTKIVCYHCDMEKP